MALPDNTAPATVQSIFAAQLSAESKSAPRETQKPEPTEEVELEPNEDTSEDADPSEESEGESAETEEAAEESDDEPAQPRDTYRTKVNGEEVEVTLDELLKGYSRTADYTRKTQEAADIRRNAETEATAAKAERATLASQLQKLDEYLQSTMPAEPDWDTLRAGDPAEYAATWAEWSRLQAQQAAVQTERRRADEQVQKDKQGEFQRFMVDEQRKLFEAIPDWKKPETAKAEQGKIIAFAKALGYSEDDIRNTIDHRAILVLRKAMLFDEAQKKAPSLKQKLETVKSATPGTGQKKPVTKVDKARKRLAQTGRSSDAVPIFLAAIQSDD